MDEQSKLPNLVGGVETAALEDVIAWALHPDVDHGTIGSRVMQRLARTLIDTNEALAACRSEAGGRERAAFEAGWRATGAVWGLKWTVSSANTPQQRIAEAYAAYEAQPFGAGKEHAR
jgi:hypothetical protein